MTVRPMTQQEKLYCYTQSGQLRAQTGNIGYLRADMDLGGKGFYSTWNGFDQARNTPAFRQSLSKTVSYLCAGARPDAFLRDRDALASYCLRHPEARIGDTDSFGFRVQDGEYAHMMRLCPERGEYNLYVYCYVSALLDSHLEKAQRGIRFINSSYQDLFTLPDGGRILIRWNTGEQAEEVCRYIDPYHVQIGSSGIHIYHICEFAEKMERAGACVYPADRVAFRSRPQKEAEGPAV